MLQIIILFLATKEPRVMTAKTLGTQPLHHHGHDYVEGATEQRASSDARSTIEDVFQYLPNDAVQGRDSTH